MTRGRRVRYEAGVTLIFAVLKALAVMFIVRMAEGVFPAALLGVYLLSRRVVSTLPNITGVGVSNTLSRYLPLNVEHPNRQYALMQLGAVLVIAANLLLFLIYVAEPDGVERLLYGKGGQYGDLALWTIVLCAFVALHFVVFGALMGQRRMLVGQVTDLLAIGGWQIVAFWVYGAEITPVAAVRFQAIAMAATVPVFLLWVLRPWESGFVRESVVVDLRVLLGYGSSRAAVTFLDALLATVGPWLLRDSPAQMGYLIVAVTILRVASVALGSLSIVGSVSVATLLGRGDREAVRSGVNMMAGFTLVTASIGAAALIPSLDRILSSWLHSPDTIAGAQGAVVILLVSIPLFALFQGLKGIVDVQSPFPWNLVNLLIANTIVVGGFSVLHPVISGVTAAALAMALAHAILGGATLVVLRHWLAPFTYFQPVRIVAAVIVTFTVAAAIDSLSPSLGPLWDLLLGATASSVGALAGGVILYCGSRGILLEMKTYLLGRGHGQEQAPVGSPSGSHSDLRTGLALNSSKE